MVQKRKPKEFIKTAFLYSNNSQYNSLHSNEFNSNALGCGVFRLDFHFFTLQEHKSFSPI